MSDLLREALELVASTRPFGLAVDFWNDANPTWSLGHRWMNPLRKLIAENPGFPPAHPQAPPLQTGAATRNPFSLRLPPQIFRRLKPMEGCVCPERFHLDARTVSQSVWCGEFLHDGAGGWDLKAVL